MQQRDRYPVIVQTDRQLMLMGTCIALWNHSEILIDLVTAIAMRPDTGLRHPVIEQSLDLKLKIIEFELGEHDIEEAKVIEIKAILGKIRTLSQKRNMIAHGTHIFDATDKASAIVISKKRKDQPDDPFSEQSLEALAAEITNVMACFQDAFVDLGWVKIAC